MATIDSNGCIPILEYVPIQSEFQGVITETVSQLIQLFQTKLHSVYVYGSVAKGRAVPKQSDLDLCVILTCSMTSSENIKLAELQEYLAAQFHQVSKIDFDIGVYSDVFNEANLYSWGYWIKHHCRCIYGEDLTVQFMPFSPSKKITEAVNGDSVEVLNDYIQQITNCTHPNKLKLLQRAASRKLIRSTDILRLENDPDWPESIEDYVQKYTHRYPEQKN
ncbi:nucleotidyltransferase domain-containing protein [Providencia sp.]